MGVLVLFKLIFTNSRGTSIELFSSPFRLISVEGLGDVEAETQSQRAPYQDGVQYIDSIFNPRPITIQLKISASNEEELSSFRKNLSSTFNPKLGLGKLTYVEGEDKKEIMVVSESIPYFPDGQGNRGRWFQKAMIDLIAPNPYWLDPNQTSMPLQAYVGNFTLPFTLPFELGKSGARTILYNEGDVPAPVRIDIQGPVTNPQIINHTTGEWLRVNRSIAADEILHINTTDGSKRVEIYRDSQVYSVFGSLDHDSNWIKLDIGENEIEHIADAGDRKSLVAVTWNSMYVGV